MIPSIVLVTIFASGFLSEGKRITAKDFPPKIPKIRPENMRSAQPFYCTDCCREDKDETTVTTSSLSTNWQTTSSQSRNPNMPAQDTTISDTTTIRNGGTMSPTSVNSADYHVDSSNATLKSEMTEAVNVSHESTHVTGDSTITASPLSTKEDTISSKATNSNLRDQETTIGDNPTFANGDSTVTTSPLSTNEQTISSMSSNSNLSEQETTIGDNLTFTTETPSTRSCSPNIVHSENCICQGTCQDPFSCQNTIICTETENCIPPEGFLMNGNDCINMSLCECYFKTVGIQEGAPFCRCSQICECLSNTIECSSHMCDQGECQDQGGFGFCACAADSCCTGNGQECPSEPIDCSDVYAAGNHSSGIYNITPKMWDRSPFPVYCNMSDQGGWTVIQRFTGEHGQQDMNSGTSDIPEFAQLNWTRYKEGFGELTDRFWIGNEKLYHLTLQHSYRLRVDVFRSDQVMHDHVVFDSFWIDDEGDNYTLHLASRHGNVGLGLSSGDGTQFSTSDRDNDGLDTLNCSHLLGGGWYGTSQNNRCQGFSLFGLQSEVQYMQMKIRPLG